MPRGQTRPRLPVHWKPRPVKEEIAKSEKEYRLPRFQLEQAGARQLQSSVTQEGFADAQLLFCSAQNRRC